MLTVHKDRPASRVGAYCRGFPFWYEFGWWIVLILAAFGITSKRYSWFKLRLGLSPTCGCRQRAEALNTIGGRLRALFGRRR
jgi:hypothetical protein